MTLHPLPRVRRPGAPSTLYDACEIVTMILGVALFFAVCVALGAFAGAAMGGGQ